MESPFTLRRGSTLLIGGVLFGLCAQSCGPSATVSQCPDLHESILDLTCTCKEAGAQFVDNGVICGECDSQDSEGQYCLCDDRSLIGVHSATCTSCPSLECDQRECDPPGCPSSCAKPACPAGSRCNISGACESCDGRCGSGCECAFGETCVAGQCASITRCCKNGNFCNSEAEWCVAPGQYPIGSQCTCLYLYPNGGYCYEPGSFCDF